MVKDNAVKTGAAQRRRLRGVHLTFAAPAIIEVLQHARLDFVYLDGEHGAFGAQDLTASCVAAERHGITPIARVPDPSAATITHFLDRGVQGIVVPHVNGLAQARAVVDAAYFAPLGHRSYGGGRPRYGLAIDDMPSHLDACNRNTSVAIMVETAECLAVAGEIAALPGVDYMSFGMMDLAQDMGHAGTPQHPAVQAAVADASQRIRAAGKPVREDFMNFAWINELIAAGARALLRD